MRDIKIEKECGSSMAFYVSRESCLRLPSLHAWEYDIVCGTHPNDGIAYDAALCDIVGSWLGRSAGSDLKGQLKDLNTRILISTGQG